MLIVLPLFMAVCSISQTHSLNMAMKEYDQLEVMPIFQATSMMCWIIGGMVILGEAANYTGRQLFGIAFSFLISCIGIKILLMKIKQ